MSKKMPKQKLLKLLGRYFLFRGNQLRNAKTGRAITDKYINEVFISIVPDLMKLGMPSNKTTPEGMRDLAVTLLKRYTPRDQGETTHQFKYPTCHGPKEWVNTFLERHGVNLNYNIQNPGKTVKPKQGIVEYDSKELERIAFIELHDYNYESYVTSGEGKKAMVRDVYSKDSIKDTLIGLPTEIQHTRIFDTRQVLSYRETCAEKTDKLVSTFLKSMGAYNELNHAVIKHWMWQVKQFLFGKKVNDPLFLNIYSEQGTGKTSFIRGLYSSLETYSFEPKIDAIRSEGFAKLWSSKFIVFFDEIRVESSDKKDLYAVMSNLKYLLTMDTNMYRMYHTQDMVEKTRTFSAIATSNQPLTDSLYDPTGMRRFFEIDCSAEAITENYTKLPHLFSTDEKKREIAEKVYKKAWQGIDESLEKGYLTEELREQVKAIQDTYKKPDCIELYEIYNGDPENSPMKSKKELHEDIIKISQDAKNVADFEEGCRKLNYTPIKVKEYRSEINEWLREDGNPLPIYGITRFPRELERYGYLVLNYKQVPYLFQKTDNSHTSF